MRLKDMHEFPGKPGVVIATSGPGATNLVTGITDAMMDSLPLVVFTGQVANTVIGTDAFQEADIIGITQPITKHNYQVNNVADFPRIIKEAFHIASTGRQGPVVVDIPKNIATGVFVQPTWNTKTLEVNLPGYQPTTTPNYLQIQKAAQAISASEKATNSCRCRYTPCTGDGRIERICGKISDSSH